jgi:23S rRNA pseudouridine2605 synthase
VPRPDAPRPAGSALVSVARALSKLGAGSRRDAERWVAEGRVRVDGRVVRDPAARVDPRRARLELDGRRVRAAAPVYLALHKPRGVVTSHAPERGAPTVYDLLPAAYAGRHLSAVGRLDKASEGLLLVTNDTRWAARVLDPAAHVPKVYHVHVDVVPDAALLDAVRRGVAGEPGEWLAAADASVLRAGTRTGWLALTLHEGRNRHIRRLLAALGVEVQRLIRVAIGPLALGALAPGAVRPLTPAERAALAGPRRSPNSPSARAP